MSCMKRNTHKDSRLWLYIIAIAVIIIFIMVVFKDDIHFSPRQATAQKDNSWMAGERVLGVIPTQDERVFNQFFSGDKK